AHTCYFILDLPTYSTVEIMYERLNYAITNCSSIDADVELNEAQNTSTILQDPEEEDAAVLNQQTQSSTNTSASSSTLTEAEAVS
ncbi:unnamed protein product, partial [Didymodactylos carnosus]